MGAITHAPFIMNHYPDVPVAMIADSSHGVLASDWQGLVTWGAMSNLPDFIPEMADITPENYDASFYIELSSQHFPDNHFAQFNSYVDGGQVVFYSATQNYDIADEAGFMRVAGEWTALFFAGILRLSQLDNFNHYTAGGFEHCIVNKDLFYEYDQSGVIFSNWFADVIAGTASNVSCSVISQDCFVSPIEDS